MHGKIGANLFLTIVMFTIVIMKTYAVAPSVILSVVGGGGRRISRRRGFPNA